ncbi:MAG: protein kinase [Planctomycetes bacterium]|nr:protein kinase [Planctomycetota bacterium]
MFKRLYLQLKNTELFYQLCEIGIMVIGRDPRCDITLNYPDISRKHCQLMVSTLGSFIEISDLDSRNGILVNNKLIAKTIMHINDTLQIGSLTMTLIERKNIPENTIPYVPKKASDSSHIDQDIDMIGSDTGFRLKQKKSQKLDEVRILGDDGGDLIDMTEDSQIPMLDPIPELSATIDYSENDKLDEILRTEAIPRLNIEYDTDSLVDQIIADYKLKELLDVTRFWKEFKGVHILLEEVSILKIINENYANVPGFEHRFRREAKVSLKLNHENILRPKTSGKFNKTYYFIRDFKETRRLEEMISKKGTLKAEIGLIIALQLSRAMNYAHKMKVIHRNINPSNVLVDNKGKVYLYDFGFAAILDQPSTGNTLTGGTIDPRAMLYRAPELFHTTPYADEQSDIYSLCAVIYYALTGFPPFGNIGEITDNTVPISLSLIVNGVSEEFSKLISRGLEKNPFKRFEYTQEFCDALEKISI